MTTVPMYRQFGSDPELLEIGVTALCVGELRIKKPTRTCAGDSTEQTQAFYFIEAVVRLFPISRNMKS